MDSVTPTIFVILEHGELLRWFDCADYMREPSDIAVAGTDFYVCDFKVSHLSQVWASVLTSCSRVTMWWSSLRRDSF